MPWVVHLCSFSDWLQYFEMAKTTKIRSMTSRTSGVRRFFLWIPIPLICVQSPVPKAQRAARGKICPQGVLSSSLGGRVYISEKVPFLHIVYFCNDWRCFMVYTSVFKKSQSFHFLNIVCVLPTADALYQQCIWEDDHKIITKLYWWWWWQPR